MSKLRLYGDTSGYVELEAPAVGSNEALVFPASGSLATEGFVGAAVAAIPGIGSNVVQTVKANTFSSTSTTFVPITGLDVTITPTSDTSKILVVAYVNYSRSSTNRGVFFRLTGGNSATFIGDAGSSRIRSTFWGYVAVDIQIHRTQVSTTASFLDSPATTGPVTYGVEGSGIATWYVNRSSADANDIEHGRAVSSIMAIEVAA